MSALGFALRATTQQAALRALRFKSGSSSLEGNRGPVFALASYAAAS